MRLIQLKKRTCYAYNRHRNRTLRRLIHLRLILSLASHQRTTTDNIHTINTLVAPSFFLIPHVHDNPDSPHYSPDSDDRQLSDWYPSSIFSNHSSSSKTE